MAKTTVIRFLNSSTRETFDLVYQTEPEKEDTLLLVSGGGKVVVLAKNATSWDFDFWKKELSRVYIAA